MLVQLTVLVIFAVGVAVAVPADPSCDGPIVRCFVNPCRTASCPGVADAECSDNYCGGCNADFYSKGVRMTKKQCEVGVAPVKNDIFPFPLSSKPPVITGNEPRNRSPYHGIRLPSWPFIREQLMNMLKFGRRRSFRWD